jgi:hypothetical protein
LSQCVIRTVSGWTMSLEARFTWPTVISVTVAS